MEFPSICMDERSKYKKKNNSGACYIATICKSGLRGKRERERLSQRFDKRGEETGFSMIIRSCTHRNSIIDTNSISRHLFVTFIDSKPVRLGLDHLSRSIRSYASCHPSCPWSSIVFRLLAIDKRRLRQFTKTIPPPPLSLLPLLFKCRINLLSFQQSSLIINETHSNSWHEINFERLIIYTWSSLIIRGEWTGGSFHRLTVLPDFASLIFIFYGQAVFKNSHAYEFDIKCFTNVFQSHRTSMIDGKTRGSKRIRKFNLSDIYNVLLHVQM